MLIQNPWVGGGIDDGVVASMMEVGLSRVALAMHHGKNPGTCRQTPTYLAVERDEVDSKPIRRPQADRL